MTDLSNNNTVERLKDLIVDAAIDWAIPDSVLTIEQGDKALRQAVHDYLEYTQPDGAYGTVEIPRLVSGK